VDPVHASAVFAGTGVVLASTGASGVTLRRFTDDPLSPVQDAALALDDGATPCNDVLVAPAVDSTGAVIVACKNGQLHRVNATTMAAGYLGT
jgi:hypothetical protein